MRIIQFIMTKEFDKPLFISELKNIIALYDEMYFGESVMYNISVDDTTNLIKIGYGSGEHMTKSFRLIMTSDYGYLLFDDYSILVPLTVKVLWSFSDKIFMYEGSFDFENRTIENNTEFCEQVSNLNSIYCNIIQFETERMFDYKDKLIIEKIPLSNGTYFGYFIKGVDSILSSLVIEEILVGKRFVVRLNDVYDLSKQKPSKTKTIVEYLIPVVSLLE